MGASLITVLELMEFICKAIHKLITGRESKGGKTIQLTVKTSPLQVGATKTY